jgi:hypothetical protein
MAAMKAKDLQRRAPVERTGPGLARAWAERVHSVVSERWARGLTERFALALIETGAEPTVALIAARALPTPESAAQLALIAESLATRGHRRAEAIAIDALRATDERCPEQLLRVLMSFGRAPRVLEVLYERARHAQRGSVESGAQLWCEACYARLATDGADTPDAVGERAWARRATEAYDDVARATGLTDSAQMARVALGAELSRYAAKQGDRAAALVLVGAAREQLAACASLASLSDRTFSAPGTRWNAYCAAHRSLLAAASMTDTLFECEALSIFANGGAVHCARPSERFAERSCDEPIEDGRAFVSMADLAFVAPRVDQQQRLLTRVAERADALRESARDEGLLLDDELQGLECCALRVAAATGARGAALEGLRAMDLAQREAIASLCEPVRRALSGASFVRASLAREPLDPLLERWSRDADRASIALARRILREAEALAEVGELESAARAVAEVERAVRDGADVRSRRVRLSRIAGELMDAHVSIGALDVAVALAHECFYGQGVIERAGRLVTALARARRGADAIEYGASVLERAPSLEAMAALLDAVVALSGEGEHRARLADAWSACEQWLAEDRLAPLA